MLCVEVQQHKTSCYQQVIKYWARKRQDGRAGQHSSPLLIETPKSELTAEQSPAPPGHRNPAKTMPVSKTKKKAQGDGSRGAVRIKPNPMHAVWAPTNWGATGPQKSSHGSESSKPHWAPRPKGLAVGGGPPQRLALKASEDRLQEPHRPWGNRNSNLGGRTQGLVHNRTQGIKAATS